MCVEDSRCVSFDSSPNKYAFMMTFKKARRVVVVVVVVVCVCVVLCGVVCWCGLQQIKRVNVSNTVKFFGCFTSSHHLRRQAIVKLL